ncbi:MAG: RagB/SusD family nutrient uptake outer membrane protein [Bacteroidales bacterium]|nr:RagB/SusD family nutrient uptake outer membrane protein [Bacteroidales bacterium]
MKTLFINSWAVIIAAVLLLMGVSSCNKYLDIVPDDGIATVDMSFNMRSTAIKWLYSCYSFMPADGNFDADPSLLGGDELWSSMWETTIWHPEMQRIAFGQQSANAPIYDLWGSMYQAFRYCNTLIERVNEVPDIPRWEKEQWTGEAKVLKAYYTFLLIRMYGPVALIHESLPVSADVDEVKVFRDPIDECFDFCFKLIDEALPLLPVKEQSRDDWGRITRPIAAAIKAKIAVYAASPLFNGNKDMQTLVDKRGVRLFPDKTDAQILERWTYAMDACKEAIDLCHENSKELYYYRGSLRVNPTLTKELDLRELLTDDWNDEDIWMNTQSGSWGYCSTRQNYTFVNIAYDQFPDFVARGGYAYVPMKVADQFYTKHGLPVENDRERVGVTPNAIRQVSSDERWWMKEGYYTAEFNFDREPRFYADLGFDGSLWFGPNKNNVSADEIPYVARGRNLLAVSGYQCKKYTSWEFRIMSATGASTNMYQWPIMRLADLYLLYAEAINEAEGPNGPHAADMFQCINKIRERAGIPTVQESWDTYSNSPGYYKSQLGMRDIIQRERLIELAFEGHRFWDLRRWKTAPAEYAKGIYGWNYNKSSNRLSYYKKTEIYDVPSFRVRDYFWPIATSAIDINPNLVQNIGW